MTLISSHLSDRILLDVYDDDDVDDDLYIIDNKELSVCVSVFQQKSLFKYSRDLGFFMFIYTFPFPH